MSAVLSPVFIEQARLRPFERPLDAVVLGLASIDLHAGVKNKNTSGGE